MDAMFVLMLCLTLLACLLVAALVVLSGRTTATLARAIELKEGLDDMLSAGKVAILLQHERVLTEIDSGDVEVYRLAMASLEGGTLTYNLQQKQAIAAEDALRRAQLSFAMLRTEDLRGMVLEYVIYVKPENKEAARRALDTGMLAHRMKNLPTTSSLRELERAGVLTEDVELVLDISDADAPIALRNEIDEMLSAGDKSVKRLPKKLPES